MVFALEHAKAVNRTAEVDQSRSNGIDRRVNHRVDRPLVVLMALQRMLPIVALFTYIHRSRFFYFGIVVALMTWALSAAIAVRGRAIGARERTGAIKAAAQAIASRSSPSVRGGAHDELLSMIWRGVEARHILASQVEPTLYASIVSLPVVFAFVLMIDGAAAAGIAAVAGGFALIARVPLANRFTATVREMVATYQRIFRDLGHGLRALDDLTAHGLVPAFEARIAAGAHEAEASEHRVARSGRVATWVPLAVGSLVMLVFFGRGIIDHTPSAWVRLAAMAAFAPVVIGLARSIILGRQQRALSAALDLLIALPLDLAAPKGMRPPPTVLAPIEWRGLTLCYGAQLDVAALSGKEPKAFTPGAKVLDEVNVRWEGEVPLALVGANGSGKSTLIGLLLRLMDPDQGSVCIGGIDLRDIEPTALRLRLAYVPQRPLVLEGMSVREAMHLVAPDRDDDELRRALARVSLLSRLEQRQGDALSVACSALSTGEAQRVALARAIARDAELIILDEPEAALDPAARAELRELLESLAAAGRKIIIATQHLDVVPRGALKLLLPIAKGASFPCLPVASPLPDLIAQRH
ncbi:MAG: hypothetical protein NVS3B20_13330 [Polyangiales bacterium]